MTLFNTDKSSHDRSTPTVNAHDVHLSRMAHATTSISPRVEGAQTLAKVKTKDSKIIANDGTNNVGLFGFDDAGNMVVKVAQPGFDANSATNDQLIFNSGQDTFKILQSGTTTIPSVGVGASSSAFAGVTVTHSLGFAPVALIFVRCGAQFVIGGVLTTVPNTFVQIPLNSGGPAALYDFSSSGAITGYSLWPGVDTTKLYIGAYFSNSTGSSATSSNIPVRYYLLQETAS